MGTDDLAQKIEHALASHHSKGRSVQVDHRGDTTSARLNRPGFVQGPIRRDCVQPAHHRFETGGCIGQQQRWIDLKPFQNVSCLRVNGTCSACNRIGPIPLTQKPRVPGSGGNRVSIGVDMPGYIDRVGLAFKDAVLIHRLYFLSYVLMPAIFFLE